MEGRASYDTRGSILPLSRQLIGTQDMRPLQGSPNTGNRRCLAEFYKHGRGEVQGCLATYTLRLHAYSLNSQISLIPLVLWLTGVGKAAPGPTRYCGGKVTGLAVGLHRSSASSLAMWPQGTPVLLGQFPYP